MPAFQQKSRPERKNAPSVKKIFIQLLYSINNLINMNILLFRIAVYFICKRAYSTLFECGEPKHVIKFLTYSFDSENFASQHTELKPLCCKKTLQYAET